MQTELPVFRYITKLLILFYKNDNNFLQTYAKQPEKKLNITTLEDPKLYKFKQEIQLAAKTVGSISSQTSTNAHISPRRY